MVANIVALFIVCVGSIWKLVVLMCWFRLLKKYANDPVSICHHCGSDVGLVWTCVLWDCSPERTSVQGIIEPEADQFFVQLDQVVGSDEEV